MFLSTVSSQKGFSEVVLNWFLEYVTGLIRVAYFDVIFRLQRVLGMQHTQLQWLCVAAGQPRRSEIMLKFDYF